jgi:hypothetical protein
MLEHGALQTHQQICTAHEFPPAFNGSVVGDAKIGPAELIFGVFKTIFDPGAQAIGVANRFVDLAFQIGHDIPGALRRKRLRVGREVVVANVPALPKDEFSDKTRALLPVGEDPFKRPPIGVADALAWRQPDAVVGADRYHIPEMQLLQFTDKVTALSIQAVCQYDLETEAPVLQLLDHLHRQSWLRLIAITWLEPGPGFEDLLRARERSSDPRCHRH